MSISTHFCDPTLWAQTHFGGTVLGNSRRSARGCTLVSGWVRQPGASIPCISGGHGYASKAAYPVLGLPQATPDALQAPHRQLVSQRRPAGRRIFKTWVKTRLKWSAFFVAANLGGT